MTSRLSQEELTNRVNEVFCVNETVYSIRGVFENNPRVIVDYGENQETYEMKTRPEAMHYLLGLRDDFGD